MSRATTRELSVEFPSVDLDGARVGAAFGVDTVHLTVSIPREDPQHIAIGCADFMRVVAEFGRFEAMLNVDAEGR